MKRKIVTVLALSALVIGITGCKDKTQEAETSAAESVATAESTATTYTTNVSESTIEWLGSKPTGTHNGTIAIETGDFQVVDGNIQSGAFKIDMNSIVDLDIPAEEEGNGKLVGHLKSADFFDVEKFPYASFEITSVEEKEGKTMLSGNLKLKDKVNNVTFPVSVSMDGDAMTLTSETFTIDRSKWDARYGSKSFFDNLGDKFISDDIELKINVVASK